MIEMALIPMFAAAGYSLLYLLLGGGLGGAILIFLVAKMLGKYRDYETLGGARRFDSEHATLRFS